MSKSVIPPHPVLCAVISSQLSRVFRRSRFATFDHSPVPFGYSNNVCKLGIKEWSVQSRATCFEAVSSGSGFFQSESDPDCAWTVCVRIYTGGLPFRQVYRRKTALRAVRTYRGYLSGTFTGAKQPFLKPPVGRSSDPRFVEQRRLITSHFLLPNLYHHRAPVILLHQAQPSAAETAL